MTTADPAIKTVIECETHRKIVLSKKNVTGLQSETSEEDELEKIAETQVKEKTGEAKKPAEDKSANAATPAPDKKEEADKQEKIKRFAAMKE